MHYGTGEGCLRIQAGDAGGSVMAEPFQRQRSPPRERGTGRSGGEQPQMTRAQQVMAGGEVEADRSLDWDTVMGNSFSARRLSTWNSLPPFQGGQR